MTELHRYCKPAGGLTSLTKQPTRTFHTPQTDSICTKPTKKKKMDRKPNVTYQQNQDEPQDYRDQNALGCKQEQREKQQLQYQHIPSCLCWLVHISWVLKTENKNVLFFDWLRRQFVSTGVQVLCLLSVLHHNAYIGYTAFPSMPLFIHTKGHTPISDVGIIWRNEEKRSSWSQSRIVQHQWEKRPFLIELFLFCT